jgi:hypothetical protein
LYASVSSRFAAYDIVEMERARSELQMHRSGCVLGLAEATARPRAPRPAPVASGRKIAPPVHIAPPLPEGERPTPSAILSAA